MRARVGLFAVAIASAMGGMPAIVSAASLDAVSASCASAESDCVAATKAYLSELQAAGLSRTEYDDRLAALVSTLAMQANEDQRCDRLDAIAAAGIEASRPFASSEAQKTIVSDIALSVKQCQANIATAALQEAASGT